MPAISCAIIMFFAMRVWGTVHSVAGDDLHHLAAEAQVFGVIGEGGDPFGPLRMDCGVALLRYYQPLFYLTTSTLTHVTGLPRLAVHNAVVILCFALSPWLVAWSLRRLGLDPWAAGLASLLCISSAAGFGNSFEAYFRPGIISQALAYVFFLPFLATYQSMLEGKGGAVLPAVLLALTMLSHAPLAVFMILVGAILFACDVWPLRRIWKKLAVFSVLSAALVAFWLIPFLTYQDRYRPVPDSVLRHGRAWLYNGLTADETVGLLMTGRMFDDGRTMKREKVRHRLDKLIDKANMGATRWVRFPLLSLLIGAGFLLALFRLKRRPQRFMASAFALGLLLYIGPDEIPWLRYIPFTHRIQGFRSTVMFELFGFAMAGMALSELGHRLWALREHVRWPRLRIGLSLAFGTAVLALVSLLGYYGGKTGDVSIREWNTGAHQRLADASEPTRAGAPLRIRDAYAKRDNRRWSYMLHKGLQSTCGHFLGLGPHSKLFLCRSLKPLKDKYGLARRMGFGYYLSAGTPAAKLEKQRTRRGKKFVELMQKHKGHWLFRDPDAQFLQPLQRAALFIAGDAQWLYVSRAWMKAMGRRGGGALLPVRADAETLENPDALKAFEVVYVLDPDALDRSTVLAAVSHYAANGGAVFSAAPLDGIETKPLGVDGPVLGSALRTPRLAEFKVTDEDAGPHEWIQGPFSGTVDLPKGGFVMLPIQHSPGWHAEVDGEPVHTLAAGPGFVAAQLPAGKHRVTFRWELPESERALLALSLLAWLIALFALILAPVRRLTLMRASRATAS